MIIPEPSFVLKDSKAIEPTLIYLQSKFTSNGKAQRVVISTGNKIFPKDWDKIRKRAIITKRNSEYSDMNIWLDKMATAFKTVFRNLMIDEVSPTQEIIKAKVEEQLNLKPQITIQKVTFNKFIEQYIEECRSFKSINTIKSYQSTYKRLKDYGYKMHKQFDFDDISLEWRTNFLQFIQGLGSTKNTEGKHIKNIKVFLNEATERGLNINLTFRSKSFKIPIEQVKKPFLTEIDINKILSLDLSSTKLLEIVRDYFILGCFTGLRYSDMVTLRQEHFINESIELETQKTREEVAIPINGIVRSILEKYNYQLPKAPCNQVFNRYLKEIGQKAELNEPYTITKTRGGSRKAVTYEKWQLVTSHIGRRSFVTNCILRGINPNSIKLMTGHRSTKVFDSYVSMNTKQNVENMKEHKFFN